MRSFAALRRRADFSRLRQRGRRVGTTNMTLFCGEAAPADERPVVGISVSKAVGKAVVRNRLRRRIAGLLHEVLGGRSRMRLLVIPRPAALTAGREALRAEFERALR